MSSDRSRVSYDAKQQYRAVVVQQGRVTVEADWNEMQTILNEEVRKEILDILGPAGTSTSDNGYRITQPEGTAHFDFVVNPGTMYVGGISASLDQPVNYGAQSDWLDRDGDPDWVDLKTLENPPPPVRELVYLYLREQEVSAVEDSALLEPALGGPDTAARVRLIQHIVRFSTVVDECTAGLAALSQRWATRGLTLDDQTLRLMSQATLKVDFNNLVAAPDPCEPVAQGGFVGAENQLIRVQISAPDKIQISAPDMFVWGFDNASFLYRVDVIDLRTLHFQSRPLDALHEPQALQAVEVLRSAAQLSNGEYIASASGKVYTLTTKYDRDTQTLTLPADLPPEFLDRKVIPQVFLRVWQEEKTLDLNNLDKPVPLGKTGLHVTLQTPAGVPFHSGDYWLIAVRPGMPRQVYPQRYLDGPQPPDGPRLWVCPLALLDWNSGILKLPIFQDCRGSFVPLTSYIPPTEGIQVINVLAKDANDKDIALHNGMKLPAESLAKGLRLKLNKDINPDTVSEAVCSVTLELPFPINQADQAVWGNMVVGYQPITLAASVEASVEASQSMEVLWNPLDDTRTFLLSDRLSNVRLRKNPFRFEHDWDVIDPPGSAPSNWRYVGDSVVQTSSLAGGAGSASQSSDGLGTVSISKQLLKQSPVSILLVVAFPSFPSTPPNTGKFNLIGTSGVVFNRISKEDYWVFSLRHYFIFHGAEGADPVFDIAVMHVKNEQVSIVARDEISSDVFHVGQLVAGISLTIKQSVKGLLFGGQSVFEGGRTVDHTPFEAPEAPKTLIKDSGVGLVGLFTRFTVAQFTRLEVVYPNETTVLIPAGANRTLTRLTLKRNFIQPLAAGSSQGTALPPTSAVQPQADFEQWFWLIPAVPGYSYSSGGANIGIGGSLI